MVEYTIEKVALQINSVNNVSRANVKFVFQRKIEYHITNTISQTFILVIVGYLSLFFDIKNFTDRTMVVLTTMLVIATILSSIQQVKTTLVHSFGRQCCFCFFYLGPAENIVLQVDRLVALIVSQHFGYHNGIPYLSSIRGGHGQRENGQYNGNWSDV